jgi:hypothetical protein
VSTYPAAWLRYCTPPGGLSVAYESMISRSPTSVSIHVEHYLYLIDICMSQEKALLNLSKGPVRRDLRFPLRHRVYDHQYWWLPQWPKARPSSRRYRRVSRQTGGMILRFMGRSALVDLAVSTLKCSTDGHERATL